MYPTAVAAARAVNPHPMSAISIEDPRMTVYVHQAMPIQHVRQNPQDIGLNGIHRGRGVECTAIANPTCAKAVTATMNAITGLP